MGICSFVVLILGQVGVIETSISEQDRFVELAVGIFEVETSGVRGGRFCSAQTTRLFVAKSFEPSFSKGQNTFHVRYRRRVDTLFVFFITLRRKHTEAL